jgi:hypothetical protein
MKNLLVLLFMVLIMSQFNCTKPKETCVPVHLNVVVRQDWNDACKCWQNTTADRIVYLEEIGIFTTQNDIDSYPHLAGAKIGDIIYKDRNCDGIIDESDKCN